MAIGCVCLAVDGLNFSATDVWKVTQFTGRALPTHVMGVDRVSNVVLVVHMIF